VQSCRVLVEGTVKWEVSLAAREGVGAAGGESCSLCSAVLCCLFSLFVLLLLLFPLFALLLKSPYSNSPVFPCFFSILDDEQVPRDPDEVQCTRSMWRKFVRSVPSSYGNSLAVVDWRGEEAPTVDEVAVRLRQYHRIIESFVLEGTPRGHLVQPPSSKQGNRQLDQVAQSPVQSGLECFQGWGLHCLSGQPVPVFHHPHCKEFLPYSQPKSTLF